MLLLAAVLARLDRIGLERIEAATPRSFGFWTALLGAYLALPLSEWVIYRRLWKLPASGFIALLKKFVSNEVLLGYSGELAFYAWARTRSNLSAAPFAAIKDVSITSALAGNIATLAMLVLVWPDAGKLHLAIGRVSLDWSIAVMLCITLGIVGLNRRIFSMPRAELAWIFAIHLLRLATMTGLAMLTWHFALPLIGWPVWATLAALQLVVMRLPIVPNKELLFAAATMMVTPAASSVANLIALIATLILAIHLVIGGALALSDLLDDGRDVAATPSANWKGRRL